MAGSSSWPLAKFYFLVNLNSVTIKFQDVDGLNREVQPIDHRYGSSPQFYPGKLPGLGKVSIVTMKRGIFTGDLAVWNDFYSVIARTTPGSSNPAWGLPTVTVTLMEESGSIGMQWTLYNALVTKYTGSDLTAEGDEVAIESLELAYENLTVSAV